MSAYGRTLTPRPGGKGKLVWKQGACIRGTRTNELLEPEIGDKKRENKFILTSALFAFALVGGANAQLTSSGNMGVTTNVQGSINMTFVTDGSGLAVTGATTSTASLPFANMQMNSGSVPANVTKTAIDGTPLGYGVQTLAQCMPCGSVAEHRLDLEVPISTPAGPIGSTVAFLATLR